ncbi:N-acetyltransferase [Nocardioides psychrotolerans]|uniref:Putative acetyltransferase n=1 Tax=Nocardioides psychrotolerans TaxID=1005945 RepID=A0A1I3FNX6_9ACTN|nr:GNAT family N-acetyltransferase [Nocardioides psychrotolerans]GEP37233.1 N-acetyltransferase [Nocardioides psychrotolerans]SFI12874.1 putative acetyltransferase [Nocardioides psychrotolerans]
MRIEPDDLRGTTIVAFLEDHVAQLRAVTPPGSSHALDLDGLRSPDVRFWSAHDDAELVGCCALKALTPLHVELKSMRTAAHRTREGIAQRLLVHLLDEARAAGFSRISLETGSFDFFAPARMLYARHGFVECEPFGDYAADPQSTFMTREL